MPKGRWSPLRSVPGFARFFVHGYPPHDWTCTRHTQKWHPENRPGCLLALTRNGFETGGHGGLRFADQRDLTFALTDSEAEL
jgi:hypothetical protein